MPGTDVQVRKNAAVSIACAVRIIGIPSEALGIVFRAGGWQITVMEKRTRDFATWLVRFVCVITLVMPGMWSQQAWSEAPAAAVDAFNKYAANVEARLAQQHRSIEDFLAGEQVKARVRKGEVVIERATPEDAADLPGALLHHWRGTAFVAAATVADFEGLMKNFNKYPEHFAPQVVRTRILSPYSDQIPDHFTASMRVRQKHVITVVMDITYDVSFSRLNPRHGYSISRSTHVDEISSPGTSKEHALSGKQEHGFLWRMNTYWSYEERDGGLYMQIESI